MEMRVSSLVFFVGMAKFGFLSVSGLTGYFYTWCSESFTGSMARTILHCKVAIFSRPFSLTVTSGYNQIPSC